MTVDHSAIDMSQPASTPPPESSADRAEATNPQPTCSVVVDQFPFGDAGTPISTSSAHQEGAMNGCRRKALDDTIWFPFRSQCDWEIACWAKMRGPSSTALAELLAIPEVCRQLQYLLIH